MEPKEVPGEEIEEEGAAETMFDEVTASLCSSLRWGREIQS